MVTLAYFTAAIVRFSNLLVFQQLYMYYRFLFVSHNSLLFSLYFSFSRNRCIRFDHNLFSETFQNNTLNGYYNSVYSI